MIKVICLSPDGSHKCFFANHKPSTRQAGPEVALERDAARTRRVSGIGPWQPEACGRDRREGRRRRRGAQLFNLVLRQAALPSANINKTGISDNL